MTNDNLAVFWIQVCKLNSLLRYEAVACSVETVTSYLVFLIIFIWQTIKISLLWHGLMESGIKHTYHWYTRHKFLTYTNTN